MDQESTPAGQASEPSVLPFRGSSVFADGIDGKVPCRIARGTDRRETGREIRHIDSPYGVVLLPEKPPVGRRGAERVATAPLVKQVDGLAEDQRLHASRTKGKS